MKKYFIKRKCRLNYILFYCILIYIFLNIFIGTFTHFQSMSSTPVFFEKETQNSNIFFVSRLIKDGNVVKQIREEEELGEIVIDDNLVANKKEGLSFFRILGLHSIGTDVKELNIVLYYLGYGTNKSSRIFSAKTKQAVRSFQKCYNLKIDGFAGQQTIGALNKVLKEKNIAVPDCEPNIQQVLSSNYWIVINKDANVLKLYKGKKLVKKYSVATGKKADSTPEGKFKIVRKTKNPYWGGGKNKDPIKGGIPQNPLGSRWLGLDYGGGRWYGIHGTNKPKSIGKHVSSGCIRMHNKDVEELYNIVTNNTIVFIGKDKQLNSYIY